MSVNAFRMRGTIVSPPMGDDTFLMDQNAFVFRKDFSKCDYPGLDLESGERQIGIWWYVPDLGMVYVFGPVTENGRTAYLPDSGQGHQDKEAEHIGEKHGISKLDLTIQGGDYAVFSYPRPEDSTKIYMMSRILSRFISREWIPMNRKVRNTMGCSYLTFDDERVCEYVPLADGMGVDDVLRKRKWSIQSWSDYIDENITEDLTLDSLAQAAGYSYENYRDVFSMYYGMTPTEYIRRRRLYIAYGEISAGSSKDDVLRKYHYSSIDQFEREYASTFGEAPGGHVPENMVMSDLLEYYTANKERIRINYRNEEQRYVLVHSIEESVDASIPNDLIERMVYWFRNEFRDFIPLQKAFASHRERLFVWGNDPVYENGQKLYKYFVGSVLKKNLSDEEIDGIIEASGAKLEKIDGGKYAVFSTYDKDDSASPEETARLLTRCALGGYINENRWRVDFRRRTFIIWRGNALFFYVPLVR